MEKYTSKSFQSLLSFLVVDSPTKIFLSILLGILAGIAYSLVIPLILMALETNPLDVLQPESGSTMYIFGFDVTAPKFALAFFILCLLILALRSVSQVIFSSVAIEAERSLRAYLYQRISRLPIADLERIGSSRLNTALHEDIPKIIDGSSMIPVILINLATVFGLLGFLVYLDLGVFLFIASIIIVGLASYKVPTNFGNKYLLKARNYLGQIHEGYRGLVSGAKELKLHRARRQAFMAEELFSPESSHVKLKKRGAAIMLTATNYGNLICFLTIGFVTFFLSNYYSLTTQTLLGIIMALLYIATPLNILMTAIIPVMFGRVGLHSLKRLLDEMPSESSNEIESFEPFDRLNIQNLCYSYASAPSDEDSFGIGPVNLTFKRGEISFIVGGNGSGKSTLGKLLSFHYLPDEGEIHMGNTLVQEQNRDSARQYVSAISTDFYLFKKLFGASNDEIDTASRYLKLLHLEDKVSIVRGAFNTTNLSDGQKKRLALIVTYLDDRDIFILDEWAADQDPIFKEVFYTDLLIRLRDAGKMVIVISHDDRYFSVADKVVVMEDGKVINIDNRTEASEQGISALI